MSTINEAVKGQDTESRREGAKERAVEKKSGKIRKNTLDPKEYATQQKKSIEWHDKRTKGRYTPGQVSDVNEVAPPGWGHTKAEKEKTKPDKPKSKIGGTAAAFKRALDDGRFKGLPGSKTKKEKTADMFKLMWAMKKKGDKPHYKPGTDKKYKKYQDKDEKNESFVLEREDSPYEKASDKALDKKYGYGTSHDKGPKTGFGRASNRATAAAVLKDLRRRRSKSTSETRADAAHKGWSHTARTSTDQTPEKKATRKKLADTPYKKLPKDEQEKDQVAADAVKKEYDRRKKTNESTMPNVDHKDRKVIRDRAKTLFKKDLKGEVRGVNEDSENFASRYAGVLSSLDRHRGPEEKKDLAKKIGQRRKKKEELSRLLQHYKDVKRGVAEGKTWKDFQTAIDRVRGKKTEMPKPKKADDAGARARRRVQRREYQNKVSVIVPPELED